MAEKMNSIVHFEIPADDVVRAKAFYEKTFGWKIEQFQYPGEPYWGVTTTEVGADGKPTTAGINGGMMKRKNVGQPFMNYINVASIDAKLAEVEKNGGKIALVKTEIGQGMGWIAAFMDTEGNLMGLHETPASMKK